LIIKIDLLPPCYNRNPSVLVRPMAPFFFRPIAYDRRNGQLPRPKQIDPWREKLFARTGRRPGNDD